MRTISCHFPGSYDTRGPAVSFLLTPSRAVDICRQAGRDGREGGRRGREGEGEREGGREGEGDAAHERTGICRRPQAFALRAILK